MKLYSAKVNLAGSLLNQAIVPQVTAAEIVLLREIHGNDAVSEIKHVANVNRADRAERARLAKIYSKTSPKGTLRGAELVHRYLGLESQPLPDDVPAIAATVRADDFSVENEEAEEIVALDEAPIKRARVPRDAAALTG